MDDSVSILKGHPELSPRRWASSQGPSVCGAQGGSVLRHQPTAGQPGGHSAADRGEGASGFPRPAALLQRYLEMVAALTFSSQHLQMGGKKSSKLKLNILMNLNCPCFSDNLERIVEIAKLRAMQKKARFAKLKVCVYKEEMPITPYERPLFNSMRFERSENEAKLFEHHCEVDVSFGPWEAVADVYDLLHCIVSDLAERGISAEQQCIGVCDKHLINHYYCKRPIYEFKITWWWSRRGAVHLHTEQKNYRCCFFSINKLKLIFISIFLCWWIQTRPFKLRLQCGIWTREDW